MTETRRCAVEATNSQVGTRTGMQQHLSLTNTFVDMCVHCNDALHKHGESSCPKDSHRDFVPHCNTPYTYNAPPAHRARMAWYINARAFAQACNQYANAKGVLCTTSTTQHECCISGMNNAYEQSCTLWFHIFVNASCTASTGIPSRKREINLVLNWGY